MCASLDMFGVPLKNKERARVFYIYDSEDYYEFDCSEKYWDMWVAKRGNSSYSDSSGLFAIFKMWSSTFAVHSLPKKLQLYLFKIDQPQLVAFNVQASTIAVNSMKDKCSWT